jgi:uncharacterized protein YecT (DUF1311 family)
MRTLGLAVACALMAIATRAGEPSAPVEVDCTTATKTHDIERCMQRELESARRTLDEVVREVRRILGDGEAAKALEKAQSTWDAFVRADCDAVYASYGGGAERGIGFGGCAIAHTQDRACELWWRHLEGMETKVPAPCERRQ